MLLLTHGDIEGNPGPKRRTSNYFSCCHWNVNSITAHNKLSLLSEYNTYVICISEIYLDKSADNDALSIDGYNIIRADHPHNQTSGGVCIYFKEQLKLKQKITPNFSECILCEISIGNKIGYIAVTYRSPSQIAIEFADFLENFEKRQYQIQQFRSFFVVILGDFNAKFESLWNEDITSNEGSQIDSLATTYGLQQLISDPTHILPNSSTCIDLIFTDQSNLVVDSDVHPSRHTNCHHQITFCKFNLIIEYPPAYQRLVWDCKRANINSIKQALYQVNWSTILSNKDVHQQVNILNSIILNVFTNYVSNKVITVDDKDPPWMTDFIKSKIEWRNNIYKTFQNSSKNLAEYNILQQAISEVSDLIYEKKNDYYNALAKKLSDPKTSSKTYWSILKTFYNTKKVPIIPPIL